MTHDELLAEIIGEGDGEIVKSTRRWNNTKALRAVVELHKPLLFSWNKESTVMCYSCGEVDYPCPTIQVIMKELE